MDDWRETELGNVCTFRAGTAFPKAYQGETEGELPFIKVSDLSLPGNDPFIRRANNWVSKETAERLKAKLVGPGAVVFAKIGEGLKSERLRLTTRPTILDNNLMAAEPRDTLNSRFSLYLFSTIGLSSWAAGSALPYLRQGDLARIPVRLPSLEEQRRIAGTIGALEDLIETNERLAVGLWSLARAAFERTQSAALEQLPLGEAIDLKYGKALPTELRRPGDVPVVSSAGISGRHDTALVEGPGVVVGRKGSVGSVTWVDKDFFPIDTAFYVQGDRVPMSWAYFILKSLPLGTMNTDSAVPGLNRANALALVVRVPEAKALREFDVLVSELITGARELRAENKHLRRTRDELLPLLMSGKVRVRPEGVAA